MQHLLFQKRVESKFPVSYLSKPMTLQSTLCLFLNPFGPTNMKKDQTRQIQDHIGGSTLAQTVLTPRINKSFVYSSNYSVFCSSLISQNNECRPHPAHIKCHITICKLFDYTRPRENLFRKQVFCFLVSWIQDLHVLQKWLFFLWYFQENVSPTRA